MSKWTYSSTISNNIYSAPNGNYGAPRTGLSDFICENKSMSGTNYVITDKTIVQRNDHGHNATYDKETGTWHSWTGW